MSLICYWHAEKYTYVISFETKSYFKVLRKSVCGQAGIIAELNTVVLEAMEKN
jgi:hypothetical protein